MRKLGNTRPSRCGVKNVSLFYVQQLLTMKSIAPHSDDLPGYPHDAPHYYEHGGYPGADQPVEEVYRCPVTTPTVTRRPERSTQQTLTAYKNMNHSLHIPNNVATTAKQLAYSKSLSSKPPMAKAQKKNFDCYFINGTVASHAIDAQMKSTWLKSLCAQPVDEIFGKYRRRSDAGRCQLSSRPKNCTPGEKALVDGWSSNASSRASPSLMSRSTRSSTTPLSRGSSVHVSSTDTYLQTHSYEQDEEQPVVGTSFALLPVHNSSQAPHDVIDDVTSAPLRTSPLFQKVFRQSAAQHNNTSISINNISANFNNATDPSVYEPYQRDKRFPDIRSQKHQASSVRKSTHTEERPHSELIITSPQKLEESAMQFVSVGGLASDETNGDTVDMTAVSRLSSSKCTPYRLQKNAMNSSMQDLQSQSCV